MGKKTKRAIVIAAAAVLLLAAAVIIFLVARAGVKGYRSISIAEIVGKVITQNNGKTYEAYKNMRLADGYALTTDPESYTRMLLDDDKYVKLEQDSHAIFEALGDAKNHKTTIRLEKGALTSEITKPLSETESYVVNTPNAVLAVRGTMFRVEVKRDKNGDYYSNVYTFGGTVVSRRIMPDGTLVDEEVEIPSGYKATVKMDEIITVYLEEKIEEEEDNIDPINIPDVNDPTLVDVYNAARHGHDMFAETSELWGEIKNRGIDLSQYKSAYDGSDIPAMDDKNSVTSLTESTADSSESSDSSVSESSSSAVSSSESRPVSSSSGSGETHEPVIVPDTSSSDEPVESSSEASVSRPATSSSRPASSSSRPASTSSEPETPPIEHTHTLKTTTAGPTCTQSGSKIVKCEDCGEVISKETLPPKGHSLVTEIVTPATCTDEGEEIDRCSVCGGQLGKRAVPALGHTEQATENDGIRTVTCSACGIFIKQVNIATGVEYPVALNETNFPDEKFREYVTEFDEDGDGVLSLEESKAVTEIIRPDKEISSLDGISTFYKLKKLDCTYLNITSIDIRNNIEVEELIIFGSRISELDVSNNKSLISLSIQRTEIMSLDVSKNISLVNLGCSFNRIPFIDISNNPYISRSGFQNNRHPIHVENGVFDLNSIEGFDYNKVSELTGADMDENGVLSGITEGVNITYTYDCGQNKSATFTLVPDESSTFAPEAPEGVAINAENFPDEKFRDYVSTNFDTDGNGELSRKECEAVTMIDVSGTEETDGGYTSLKGVENFGKLERLYCYYNSGLTELDVSNNIALRWLSCYETSIPCIDISNNPKISYFNTSGNNHPIHVEDGVFDLNSIEGFDYNKVSELTGADMDENGVLSGITEGTNITYTYDCGQGKSAMFTLVPDESSTFATETPEITYPVPIDEEHFPDEVFRQYVSENFDADGNGVLSQEECEAVKEVKVNGTLSVNGRITSLEGVENFSKLEKLYCGCNSKLTSLDVSKNTALEYLNCYVTKITSLDVSKNIALTYLNCDGTKITSLDVSNNTAMKTLICSSTQITSFDVNKNTALEYLDCSRTQITSLDVSTNIKLSELRCHYTQIISLDVSKNIALTYLNCDNTKITSLDVSNNSALKSLSCNDMQITSLDVSNNTALTTLNCTNTQITSLDVSKNTVLTGLSCFNTQITSLDLSNNTALKTLNCQNTQITSLDVSNNTALINLNCHNTQIPFVDISNNPRNPVFSASNNYHPIPSDAIEFDTSTIKGFDMSRVSNVQNAKISGKKFVNITGDVSYTYDCKGTGESDYMETFTLVRTAEATASLSDDDNDNTPSALPPDDTDTTPPPNAPEETGGAMNEDAALPPDNTESLRYLPLGILAPGANRKRKKLYVKRKAKI